MGNLICELTILKSEFDSLGISFKVIIHDILLLVKISYLCAP